jgi:hypothetical protein
MILSMNQCCLGAKKGFLNQALPGWVGAPRAYSVNGSLASCALRKPPTDIPVGGLLCEAQDIVNNLSALSSSQETDPACRRQPLKRWVPPNDTSWSPETWAKSWDLKSCSSYARRKGGSLLVTGVRILLLIVYISKRFENRVSWFEIINPLLLSSSGTATTGRRVWRLFSSTYHLFWLLDIQELLEKFYRINLLTSLASPLQGA